MKLNRTKEQIEESLKISLMFNGEGAKKATELYSDLLALHAEVERLHKENDHLNKLNDYCDGLRRTVNDTSHDEMDLASAAIEFKNNYERWKEQK